MPHTELHESASVSTRRFDDGWLEKHQALVNKARKGGVRIAFFGDSITEAMDPVELAKYFSEGSKNFGIGGDCTQHLIWRLENGELDFSSSVPELFILLIGTNNLSTCPGHEASTDQELVAGVKACVDCIRKKIPSARVLVLGILPRGLTPDDKTRQRVDSINPKLKTLADSKKVFFADLGKELLEHDGTLSYSTMPDLLHPSQERGYPLLFLGIQKQISNLGLLSKNN